MVLALVLCVNVRNPTTRWHSKTNAAHSKTVFGHASCKSAELEDAVSLPVSFYRCGIFILVRGSTWESTATTKISGSM